MRTKPVRSMAPMTKNSPMESMFRKRFIRTWTRKYSRTMMSMYVYPVHIIATTAKQTPPSIA